MDNNNIATQQEGTQQAIGEVQQADQGQQRTGMTQYTEKLFTQTDVDRIVGNRLARMKQDLETSDIYRRERDEARRELEQYKNNAFLKEKGVPEQYLDYVSFKASQGMDDTTSFQQAAESFLKGNPSFINKGKGYKVVSTGSPDGGHGNSGAGDEAIRMAMGLKG